MKKRNHGFTLVELVVTMAVASIVMLAATTTLLSYIRINKQGTDVAIRQNTVQIVTSVITDLAAESTVKSPEKSSNSWKLPCITAGGAEETLFEYRNSAIYVRGTELLTNVVYSDINLRQNGLLEIDIKVKEGEKEIPYKVAVYCRLAQPTEPTPKSASSTFTFRSPASEPQSTDWSRIRYADARKKLISVLEAEKGSTGASLTTGEYFSEWYIGGYAGNPGWNQETPWCACFVSWALEQCSENLLTVPKYAHVEEFMNSFPIDRWKTSNPQPGDIIFFDWVENNTKFPQHVGVVTAVENGTVRTIEGNADGEVASRVYALDDGRILGYGVLNWV